MRSFGLSLSGLPIVPSLPTLRTGLNRLIRKTPNLLTPALAILVWVEIVVPTVLIAQADQAERPSVRAHFLGDQRVRLDGVLDEAVWREADKARDFVQKEPYVGQPATENTEVQFAFSSASLFVAVRAEAGNLIAREQKRDARLSRDDSIALIFDTFLDRRNAYVFETNGNGARNDSLVTEEGRDLNLQWDGVWRVASKRTAEGFVAEIEIPFSTLRFDPRQHTWGLQIVRRIASKNEETVWSPVGRDADEMRISLAGTLTGLTGLVPSQQLHIKPFVTASSSRSFARPGDGSGQNDRTSTDTEVGLDAKWGISRSFAVDLTVNTDFAEVEVDEQQVNLTRFPLFFPEKREFFLENAGLFEFGPVKRGFDFDPILMKVFFSRRIGLDDQGQTIPIEFGGRLTGRIDDRWNIGALAVRTRADSNGRATTDFGVARVVRNLGQRSSVGFIATERQGEGSESNRVLGLDATLNPTQRLNLRGFLSHSSDRRNDGDGRERSGHSLGFSTAYEADTWTLGLEGMEADQDFEPRMGFLLRRDFRSIKPRVQIRTRIEKFGVRNLQMGYTWKYVSQHSTGVMETRQLSGDLIGFETFGGSSFFIWAELNDERLLESFEIHPGVVIEKGRYDAAPLWNFFYWSPRQKKVFLELSGSTGGFFDGDQTSLSTGVEYRPNKFLQLGLNRSWTEIDLPGASFSTEVLRLRSSLSFSPRQRLDTLVQFNDAAEVLGLNLRYNWIYRPGADLYLVYNRQWQATTLSRTEPVGDQVVLKFTYLFSR